MPLHALSLQLLTLRKLLRGQSDSSALGLARVHNKQEKPVHPELAGPHVAKPPLRCLLLVTGVACAFPAWCCP